LFGGTKKGGKNPAKQGRFGGKKSEKRKGPPTKRKIRHAATSRRRGEKKGKKIDLRNPKGGRTTCHDYHGTKEAKRGKKGRGESPLHAFRKEKKRARPVRHAGSEKRRRGKKKDTN